MTGVEQNPSTALPATLSSSRAGKPGDATYGKISQKQVSAITGENTTHSFLVSNSVRILNQIHQNLFIQS
jgi:hypothetical protein